MTCVGVSSDQQTLCHDICFFAVEPDSLKLLGLIAMVMCYHSMVAHIIDLNHNTSCCSETRVTFDNNETARMVRYGTCAICCQHTGVLLDVQAQAHQPTKPTKPKPSYRYRVNHVLAATTLSTSTVLHVCMHVSLNLGSSWNKTSGSDVLHYVRYPLLCECAPC